MRIFINTLILATGLVSAAFAEQKSQLRTLLTGDDSRGWEAVGRLDIDNKTMCTGALIAPDLVLTAAHCLYNKDTNQRFGATKIKFMAGWRSGRATAYAQVKRAVVHPEYTFSGSTKNINVRNDIAVLQLTRPIRKTSITPFATGVRPRKGASVGIVSYAHDRAQSPSIEESCKVLARQSGTLILSCDVDFGSSGAPIFNIENGQARIISVVSAKAEVRGKKVSLGTSLEEPLAVILAKLKETEGPFQKPNQVGRLLVSQGPIDRSGAKFLRP